MRPIITSIIVIVTLAAILAWLSMTSRNSAGETKP